MKTKSIAEKKEIEYKKVFCYWLDTLKFDLGYRNHIEEFKQITSTYEIDFLQVTWVSERYYCVVRCLLLLNEQRKVLWDDIAEITNVLIFICGSRQFKELPFSYPYTKEIEQLKEKLKVLCADTQHENEIMLCLDIQTRYYLLLHKQEMSVFQKITFTQLLKSISSDDFF